MCCEMAAQTALVEAPIAVFAVNEEDVDAFKDYEVPRTSDKEAASQCMKFYWQAYLKSSSSSG